MNEICIKVDGVWAYENTGKIVRALRDMKIRPLWEPLKLAYFTRGYSIYWVTIRSGEFYVNTEDMSVIHSHYITTAQISQTYLGLE